MAIPLAGTRYAGLSPLELQKILSDADYEDYLESGTLPQSFASNQTGQTNNVKTTTVAKGRGNVLGYQTGGKPTVTYEGSASDIRDLLKTSDSGSDSGSAAEEEEKEKKIFQGSVGGVSIRDIGEQGFGMKDYQTAIAAGYDRDSIGDYLRANMDSLYNIGPGAREEFGITDYESLTPGVYDYSTFGGAGFDEEDLKDLQARKVSDEIIKGLAKQAPTLSSSASKELGLSPTGGQLAEAYRRSDKGAPARQREATKEAPITGFGLGRGDGSGFAYENYGGSGFGLEDVRALESRGASKEDLKRIASGAPGGRIGEGARSYLGL